MDRQNELQNLPEDIRLIYTQHWNTIKDGVKRGRIRDTYHYPLFLDDTKEIVDNFLKTLSFYDENLKVNVSFGFVLKNITTNQLRFFHPSNNTTLFEYPRLLDTPNSVQAMLSDIELQDAAEFARTQRPSTKWKLEKIACVRFDVYKLK